MIRIDTPALLADICRLHAAGRTSDHVLHASIVEAVKNGVDTKPVLIAAGIDPAYLPRYATLVTTGFFNTQCPNGYSYCGTDGMTCAGCGCTE